MAIVKLFDEDELSEVRKKCQQDAQLMRLLNFYLLQDGDGVEAFIRANNNLLMIFADHIEELAKKIPGIVKADLDKLLEIGVEGGKIAKLLRELKKAPKQAARPKSKKEDPENEMEKDDEEEDEDIPTDENLPDDFDESESAVDRRARRMKEQRL